MFFYPFVTLYKQNLKVCKYTIIRELDVFIIQFNSEINADTFSINHNGVEVAPQIPTD